MPDTYRDQQNQLWIYLSICWWIGSLVAWISILFSESSPAVNDSTLTFSGILVFAVSAALRLPILTSKPETSSLEDHFVWLLCVTANVNWIGFLWLCSPNLSATLPAIGLGLLCEAWLWSEAERSNSIRWLRLQLGDIRNRSWRIIAGAAIGTQSPLLKSKTLSAPGSAGTSSSKTTNSTATTAIVPLPIRSLEKPCGSQSIAADPDGLAIDQANSASQGESEIVRTSEDGIDPSGRRYLAGEIVIQWQPDQRSHQIVISFVPAFAGVPEVEIELDSLDCMWQLQNCTPVGLRLQVRRPAGSEEAVTNLSWYARAASEGAESPPSQPQSLA